MSAPSKYIPNVGLRHSRPKRNPSADVAKAKLSPEEFFLFQQVDGKTSYGQLVTISGLSEARAGLVIGRLKELRLILGETEPVPKPSASGAPPNVAPLPPAETAQPAAAEAPRRSTGASDPGPPPPVTAGSSPSPPPPTLASSASKDYTPTPMVDPRKALREEKDREDKERARVNSEATSILAQLDDKSTVDPMLLVEGPDLKEDFKMRILRVHRRLKEMHPYQLLGVPIGADKASLKKGYRQASKELHPDLFYGKDIGPYRQMLNDIHAMCTKGFEQLLAMNEGDRARFDAQLTKRLAQQRKLAR